MQGNVQEKHSYRRVENVSPPELNKCDTIRKRNGELIIATVTSESSKEIIYQLCGKENGSKYFMKTADIESISYSDGRFKEVNPPVVHSSEKQSNTSNSNSSGDRSQWIALLLVVLVGAIGVHRIYLGYYAWGALYFLTFGFCLIGVIVDVILILTGDLQPKNGNYTDQIF